MKFAWVAMMLAAGCNGQVPENSDSTGRGDQDDFNDFDPGGTSYPYEGSDAAYVTVLAEFDGQPIPACTPVLFARKVITINEDCGEPIAVAPNTPVMITVGDELTVCQESCWAQSDAGWWDQLPLQQLDDGGQAIGVPATVTLGAGEELTVTVNLNQFVQGDWTCTDGNDGGGMTSEVWFEGTDIINMPTMGDLIVNGRSASYQEGDIIKNGEFTDSFSFSAQLEGGLIDGERIVDCWAEE